MSPCLYINFLFHTLVIRFSLLTFHPLLYCLSNISQGKTDPAKNISFSFGLTYRINSKFFRSPYKDLYNRYTPILCAILYHSATTHCAKLNFSPLPGYFRHFSNFVPFTCCSFFLVIFLSLPPDMKIPFFL